MKRPPALRAAALGAVFVAGAAAWAVLLSAEPARLSGPVPTLEDWPKEFRYYAVLRQAVVERRLPLFLSRPILAGRKLMALPELNCTPPVLLLGALSTPRYVLVDTLLAYTAGFAGLLLLRRRYGLGPAPFAVLFLFFFFNGHLVAHMAVGHSMWAAHLLLPFFVLGLLELVEGGRPGTPALLALVLFAILLRGGLHLFAWCSLFLLLLAAFNPRRARAVGLSLLGAGVLGAVRLAPAAFLARHWQGAFLSGFPSLGDFLRALVSIPRAAAPPHGGFFGQLSPWEYDTYVGPFGLVLLLVYGVALAARQPALAEGVEKGLYGPMAVMALLSLGDAYLPINLLPLPVLGSERVATRLLLLPVIMLATLAALRMQRLRDAPDGRRRTLLVHPAAALAVALTAAGLAAHAWAWRVQALLRVLPPRRGLLNVELVPVPSPLAGSDLAYVVVVAAAALVSLAALVALAVLHLRRRRKGGYELSPAGGMASQAGRHVAM